MTNPHKDIRAGHRDREDVVALLQTAYADGRLTEDDLRDRVDATETSRTFGDLDDVVADLPVTPPSLTYAAANLTNAPVPVDGWAVPSGPIGSSVSNPLVLDGGWSSEKRDGSWEIPKFLRLRGGMGSVTVNCLEATTPHSVIHVWVDGDLGSITIIVPEGWAADIDGLKKSLGSAKSKIPREPTGGRPVIVVNGSMGMGSFTVRHANWFERRRTEKNLR